MSLPLYVLRHSISTVSPALYTADYKDQSVEIVQSQSNNPVSFKTVAFRHVGKGEGEPGTYRELLELVLTTKKVVTL